MRYSVIFLLILLPGCTQLQSLQGVNAIDLVPKLQTIALEDAQHAMMLAMESGDDVPLACLGKIIQAIMLTQEATKGAQGIFTMAEIARIIRRMNIQQDCTAVIASF